MNLKRFIPQSFHPSKCIPFLRLCSVVQCKAGLNGPLNQRRWHGVKHLDVMNSLPVYVCSLPKLTSSRCNISVHIHRIYSSSRSSSSYSVFAFNLSVDQPTDRITNKPTQSILNLKCHRVLATTNVNHEYKIHF